MLQQLSRFRSGLYQALPKRADAALDLVDALASTPSAHSVIELSQSEPFRRGFPCVYDAVEHFFKASSDEEAAVERLEFQKELLRLGVSYLPEPIDRKFLLYGVDCVSIPRLYAATLEDRSFVYQPTVVRGNKPITIGHSYSTFAALPEPEAEDYGRWIFPLLMQRVTSDQKATEVAQEQINLLLNHTGIGHRDQLSVTVGDTAYSTPEYLCSNFEHENHVSISRLRSNRKLYRPYDAGGLTEEENRQGHPCWYGEEIRVMDQLLWQNPDETTTVLWTTKRGKTYTVTISAINDLRMRGKRAAPMHDKPIKLVRIKITDEEGKAVYKKPVYLVVCGKRQAELTLQDIYHAFKARFNLEHFFRFGKQRLLLAKAQTPVVESEENWCNIVMLAYQQLFLARRTAQEVRRPWERKSKTENQETMCAKSPSETQRDFARIIREIGTPAKPPKPRNKSKGRPDGFYPKPRIRLEIVKKT
jgi:hypothetical protein